MCVCVPHIRPNESAILPSSVGHSAPRLPCAFRRRRRPRLSDASADLSSTISSVMQRSARKRFSPRISPSRPPRWSGAERSAHGAGWFDGGPPKHGLARHGNSEERHPKRQSCGTESRLTRQLVSLNGKPREQKRHRK